MSDTNESLTPQPLYNEAPATQPEPRRIDIVIPYVHSKAAWDELKYALRSIEKAVQFPFKLHIVADRLPLWANPDEINLIKVKQIYNIKFAHCFDSYRKLAATINCPDVADDFIWAYDDQIWARPIKEDFFSRVYGYEEVKTEAQVIETFKKGGSNWKTAFFNSIQKLLSKNLSCFNHEIHMPRMFNKKKALETFNEFDLGENSANLFSTIYYNHHADGKKPINLRNKKYKGEVRSPLSLTEIESVLSSCTFLDYNDKGLDKNLKIAISERYPDKSRFED